MIETERRYTCKVCGNEISIHFPYTEDELNRRIYRWKAGALIQTVFPELDADARELMISGICGVCFDALTKEE